MAGRKPEMGVPRDEKLEPLRNTEEAGVTAVGDIREQEWKQRFCW